MVTGYTVQIEGLDSLMRWLKEADPKLQRALKRALKESMSPVLRDARSNAARIQDDYTYGASLAIASRKNGTQYILKTSDPNAGVKEFAREGAVMIRNRANTPRSARMVANHARVGVPRGSKPRVMVPAVEGNADAVKRRMEACIEEVLKEVEHA